MGRGERNEYAPETVSPPGEALQDLLEERGMSQAELAERTGRPRKTINEIIQGKSAITPDTALQLERVLSVPARFWNNRESNYREHLARKEDETELGKSIGWLRDLPLSFMIKKGWIEKKNRRVDQSRAVLAFFGVSSPAHWSQMFKSQRAHFRQSSAFAINSGAVAAWLRQGELQAKDTVTDAFDKETFLPVLQEIRLLTKEPPDVFEERLSRLCARAGVAVVFVPPPPGCRASGATQWVSSTKALIQLSLRYKTDDQLWFTFFHEAGHILKHPKKAVFLEGLTPRQGRVEDEANRFASEILIPQAEYLAFVAGGTFSRASIGEFASDIGVAPGIVVGRLQHDQRLPWNSPCSSLKRSFRWIEESG